MAAKERSSKFWISMFVLAVALLVWAAASGVTEAQGQQVASYGVKAGVSSASMALDTNLDHQGSRTGLAVAGFAVVSVPDIAPFFFQPEVHFVQKGMTWEDTRFDENYRLNLSYLEVPLLLRYNLSTSAESQYSPFFVAGPAVALRIGATSYWDDLDHDASEDVDSKDFGFIVGGGVQRGLLSLEARGSLGLLNVSTEEGMEAKNRALTLILGYAIP